MQPPIAIGTLLQNRYRLLSILGQGGFGRTYLVEDLGRFQERCALKELIPVQTDTPQIPAVITIHPNLLSGISNIGLFFS